MIRFAVAALLLAAPVAANAATAVHKPAAKPAKKPMRMAPRPSGSAETDRLNDQSLQRAMGR